jgi:hypothetical protein
MEPRFWAKKRGGAARVVSRWSLVAMSTLIFGAKIRLEKYKRLQMWENLHKCFERWKKNGEKALKNFKKVIEEDEKKARGAEKRGEIEHSR